MELPPVPFTVRAIAPYQPNSATELALVAGELYQVSNTDGKGIWLQGQVNGVYGWFPLSYTEIVDPTLPPVQPSTTPFPQSSGQYTTPQPVGETKPAADITISEQKQTTPPKKKPSPATKFHIEKNKKGLSTTVVIHVIAAELNNCDPKKTDATAWLFMKDYTSVDEGRRFDCTEVAKKTSEPFWNESFTMVVTDPELEVAVVRVVNGKTYDRKKLIGEVEFILRSSVRDFDSPDFQNKWYPLVLKEGSKDSNRRGRSGAASSVDAGRIHICIQYIDTRETGAPTDFKRISHIGWSAEGGFDISNIPAEWKVLFKQVGIKKRDLMQNQDLAKDVFDIMNTATQDASVQETVVSDAPPPPPLMQQAQPAAPSLPQAPVPSAPSPAAQEPSQTSPSNDLLSAIRRGTQLTKVEVEERPAIPSESGGLTDLLRKAMAGRVKATSGETDLDEGSDSDWSDD